MAWEFVGVSNVVEVTGTAHALVTTGISGTLQAGDLLIACISSRIASTTSITLPTGGAWTLVGEQKTSNTAATTAGIASGLMAYAIRGASNPNLTFTHPVAPSVALGRIIAYRNVNQSSPKDTQSAATTAGAVTAVSVAGLTTTQAEDLIVAMVGGQEAAWSAFNATDPIGASAATVTTAPTTTWSERADSLTTTGGDTSLAIFDAVKLTAGATGNFTATASVGGGNVVIAGAFKIFDPIQSRAPVVAGTGTASGVGCLQRSGIATWNPDDKVAALTLSNSNRTVEKVAGTAGSVRSTSTVAAGEKVYFEVVIDNLASPTNPIVGFAPLTADLLGWPGTAGTDLGQFGVHIEAGFFYHLSSPDDGYQLLPGSIIGDRLDFAFDRAALRLWVRRNGGSWNAEYDPPNVGDPVAGAFGVSTPIGLSPATVIYHAIGYSNQTGDKFTAHFDPADFVGTAPTGYVALGSVAIGPATTDAVGTAAGVGTAAATSEATKETTGTAAGIATANADGSQLATVAGTGNATSTASATGVAVSIITSDGTAAGVGTAAATGASFATVPADGSAAGVGTASATGAQIAGAPGTAPGVGTASASAQIVLTTAATAAGVGTATAGGAQTAAATASAAGVGTASATGEQVRPSIGTAPGVGTAAATGDVGSAAVSGVGSAAGIGTATAEGRGVYVAQGSATGVGSTSATGVTIATAQGSAPGIGTATATGFAAGVIPSVGSAASIGSALALSVAGAIESGVGAAAGVGTAAATSLTIAGAAGTAAGVGTATATGAKTAATSGTAAGIGTASAASLRIFQGAGTAAGVGTASATGRLLIAAAGTAAGVGTASAPGAAAGISAGVGGAIGIGSAAALSSGATVSTASGAAAGVGTATVQGRTVVHREATASGIGTASATALSFATGEGAAAGIGTAAATALSFATVTGSAAGVGTAASLGSGGIVSSVGTADGAGTLAAISATAFLPPHPANIIHLALDNRRIALTVDNRTVTADAENRTITLEADDRRIEAVGDNREILPEGGALALAA